LPETLFIFVTGVLCLFLVAELLRWLR
jgi:hypothetical protein